MKSSADVALLFNLAELARRFGLRPSEADASIDQELNGESLRYILSFGGMTGATRDKFDRMCEALGCNADGEVIADDYGEIEDIVEQALDRAPRQWSR